MPLLLKEFAGLQVRLVAGYAANSDILLAVERKEADSYSALATTIQLAVDRGAVRPLVRSRTPVPGWNHLPTDESLATNDTGNALMAIRGIPQSIGRAFAVRPGTPPERVAMLREALAKTLNDPEFLAEAEKAKIEMEYISPETVTQVVRRNAEPAAAGAGGDEQISQGRRISRSEWSRPEPSYDADDSDGKRRIRTQARPTTRRPGEDIMRHVRWGASSPAGLIASMPPHARSRASRFLQGQDHHDHRGHAGRRLDRQHLAAHQPSHRKYIPGNPTVILRQMPGGAHLNATNHVFNVADADGLTILAANPAIAMAQLAKVKAVRFDVRQFQWIGSTGPDGTLFAIRSGLPYKSFKELQTAKEDIVVGTTGPGSNSHDVPLLLKEFAGAKFKLLAGFQANGDIRLALERGEADGWSALSTPVRPGGGQPASYVRWCAAAARSRASSICPWTRSWCRPASAGRCMVIRGTPLAIGRPFAVRPGMPADRVAMLRGSVREGRARSAVPGREGEARRSTSTDSAEEVTKDFAAMMSQPPEAVAAMVKYFKLEGGG